MSLPRYLEYKDSGVEWLGEVPGHWEVWKLSHAFDVIGSGTTPKSDNTAYYDDGQTAWVNTGDLNDGELFDCEKRVTGLALAEHSSLKIFPSGSLVIAMYGATIGKLAMLKFPATVNQACCVFVEGVQVQSKFLFYWFTGLRQQIISLATGGGQPNISQEILRGLRLACPTHSEQQTIAAFLDRETGKIDALITEQQRLVELLAEKRQAVISHAVTKGLNPNATMKDSGIEWLDVVPEHWEVKRLKTLSPFISVGIVVNPSEYVSGEGLPFIYGGDITEGKIAFETSRRITDVDSRRNEKTRLSAGDLLTVRVGAPGITAVVPPECEGGNCASVMHVRKGNFNSQWLCYSMNDKTVRYQVEVVQYGAAQEQFNIGHAINFWIATPPLEEQNAIAAFLDTVTAKFATLTAEANRAIALLQEHRSTLISAAVTGKIDVRRHTGAGRYPVDERIPA